MKELNFCYEDTSKQRKMALYNANYREKNSQLIFCECGSVFKSIGMYQHNRTKKHIAYIEQKKDGGGGEKDTEGGLQ